MFTHTNRVPVGRAEDRTGQDRTGQDRTGQDRTGQESIECHCSNANVRPVHNTPSSISAHSGTELTDGCYLSITEEFLSKETSPVKKSYVVLFWKYVYVYRTT